MPAILVEGVSKSFRRYDSNRPHTLQEAVLRGFRDLRARETFWALRDVSLQVEPGEMLGVIGRNGAGKTSLLRLVGGIGRPDSGTISVAGRLGALIELGAGYHPELTGRENVFMNGVISGLNRREVSAVLDEIIAFSELEEFIDSPLRTYSSGMQLRLAFAVAVHVRPEVLLVDEVLAVGDLGFQQKCLERIQQLRENGAAILFVTHDLEQAQRACDRLVWLNRGRVAASGSPADVVDSYRTAMQRATRQKTPHGAPAQNANGLLTLNENRFGTLEVEISGVRLLDPIGGPVTVLAAGSGLNVRMDWKVARPVGEVIFSVGIHRADGALVSEVYAPPGSLSGESGQIQVAFDRLDLAPGAYFVDVGVYPSDWSASYDYHWQVYPLTVENAAEGKGPLRPPHQWMKL